MEITPALLLETCLRLEGEIESVLSLKGAWENWLQVEIARSLQQTLQTDVMLESQYHPDTYRAADIAFCYNGKRYLVELKVEYARAPGTIGGKALQNPGGDDLTKMQAECAAVSQREACAMYVMVVGYSQAVVARLRKLVTAHSEAYFRQGAGLGVALYVASDGRRALTIG